MKHTHLIERWAIKRLRPAIMQTRTEEGIDEYSFIDKGSVIQEVGDRLLRTDAALLIKGRWRVLERRPEPRSRYMVRDGWFQKPIVVLWRISWVSHFLCLSARSAWFTLWAKEADNE